MLSGFSELTSDDDRPRPSLIWYPVLFLATAAAAIALTLLFRSMRSVMLVGGACASGGSFEIHTPCPKGIPLLMNLAIWGGIIAVGVMLLAGSRLKAPGIVWLAWPALFLSLGYNFFEFGIDPPGGGDVVVGWIICGTVFGLMGAIPLWLGLTVRKPSDASKRVAGRALALTTAVRNVATPPNVNVSPTFPLPGPRPGPRPGPPPPGGPPSLVADLEQLAALHRSGALSDDEFQDAKNRLLGRA